MTYTEEFIPAEQGGQSNEGSAYPTLFGITFTPMIGGVILGVLGVAGAAYLFYTQVKPVTDKHQELEASLSAKQTELQQKTAKLKNIDAEKKKLEEAKQQKKAVQALFSNEKTLDTLLLDINRSIDARQGKLSLFEPEKAANTANAANAANTADPDVINDGSLGPELNGKLKRKTVKLALTGDFDQIQSVMRSIERMQQMLVVKDFQATQSTKDENKNKIYIKYDQQGRIVPINKSQIQIDTTFKVDALIPLTPEEAAANAAAAAAPPKK